MVSETAVHEFLSLAPSTGVKHAMRYIRVLPEECWEWTGALTLGAGYGRVHIPNSGRSESVLAHRFVYTELVGPIPHGMVLDHLCRNRSCVRPSHLEPVTQGENARRAGDGYCRAGHLLADEGCYVQDRIRGRRLAYCRACRRLTRSDRAGVPEAGH